MVKLPGTGSVQPVSSVQSLIMTVTSPFTLIILLLERPQQVVCVHLCIVSVCVCFPEVMHFRYLLYLS